MGKLKIILAGESGKTFIWSRWGGNKRNVKELVCQAIRADTTNGFFLSANLYFIASKLWGICWDGE